MSLLGWVFWISRATGYFILVTTVVWTVVTLALFAASFQFPAATYHARVSVSFGCLVLCAIYGVIASLALRIVGYGGLSQYTVARAFKWTMWATTGVTFVVQDEHYLQPRPAVFIGNHQTYVFPWLWYELFKRAVIDIALPRHAGADILYLQRTRCIDARLCLPAVL